MWLRFLVVEMAGCVVLQHRVGAIVVDEMVGRIITVTQEGEVGVETIGSVLMVIAVVVGSRELLRSGCSGDGSGGSQGRLESS